MDAWWAGGLVGERTLQVLESRSAPSSGSDGNELMRKSLRCERTEDVREAEVLFAQGRTRMNFFAESDLSHCDTERVGMCAKQKCSSFQAVKR